MFIVLLRFGENKAEAGRFMEAHNAWIARGFADGVFVLLGSLQPKAGGAILARGVTRPQLCARVDEDPFVAERIASAEILEVTPSRADDRLAFLLA